MAYFPEVSKIEYEGPESRNPLAFHHYNPSEVVAGKSMEEWLRFSVCYWHTFRGNGTDPFGAPTMQRPWEDGTDSVDMALKRVDVAFEFMEKLGAPFYCFHDRDVAPEGSSLRETNAILDKVVAKLKAEQERTSCTEPRRPATPTCSPTPPLR
jgi:xylose isomerase